MSKVYDGQGASSIAPASSIINNTDADVTLLPSQSGSTILSTVALTVGAKAFTLPVPAASKGCSFRAIQVQGGATQAEQLNFTSPTAGTLKGMVQMGATTTAGEFLASAGATMGFTTTSLAGDYMNFICDGTNWYVSGQGCAAASFATA